MPRRVVLLLSLLALALLGTAVAPWTLTGGGLAGVVGQQLKDDYGLDFAVERRTTFALLPVPRVKFEGVRMATADRSIAVDGGTLRGELRFLPLLLGQIDLRELSLSEARVTVRGREGRLGAEFWQQALDWAKADEGTLRRLTFANTVIATPAGRLDDVDVMLNWPDRKAGINVAGAVRWRDERVTVQVDRLSPALLASGKPAPFEVSLQAPAGTALVIGETQLGTEPRVTGHSTLAIRSVRDLARWTGVGFPLGSLLQAVSIEGDFSADRRRLSWPSVNATVGSDKLEGTLSLRFDDGRSAITGTLAADRFDLSPLLAPFTQARTPAGQWSNEEPSVLGTTGGDLDLRLSANEARMGRLRLGEMAASVIVRPGRVEASLSRAQLNKGTFKGRLSLAAMSDGTELKAQGTFDHIDAAGFLNDLGQGRWLTGQAQGQFALESTGRTVADLVRQSHGRTALTVKQGEVVGINLGEALKRVEKRPLAASLDWKGGRTAFDQIHLALNVASGVGEIAEGTLAAPSLRTALQGQVSLFDRWLSMRALVDPATAGALPSPVIVFDVNGGWDDVAVVPDARSLIERSGAAKPLFGSDRIVPANQASPPLATAQ
ncbi:MAG TPA: AsmA-like C-terminal region-containing protein [Microvirga sp.]|jgi:AsmA protein|nr:AsmA-like C-terminal region-containing protein [Microvirga sp.]